MKNFLIISVVLFGGNVLSQDVIVPNTEISPFSLPQDCLYIQYNAAVIGKKAVLIYETVEDLIIDNPDNPKVQAHLLNAKNLADLSISLTKQYEVFCNRR
ncbi:hypothetical protein N9O22_05315 [Gammaproteobacteria bacterium]|nr:hypothetical protein [Gammaproteobacteria bacterium]MDC1043229.1 hypothetical protein [Gammaproteobacteria bacterium]